jgi:alcohol dehydrogenase
MQDFEFWWPTQMRCGPGVINTLPEWVEQFGAKSVLLVCDPGVIAAGLLARVQTALAPSPAKITVFSDIRSDPEVRSVLDGLEAAKDAQCDLVIGLGGGSVLDVAKAIAVLLKNPGDIRTYLGVDNVPGPGAPVIAIPTTAGTGSEVTVWSVLTDREKDQKVIMGSYHNCPRLALLDPLLTLSLPPKFTAATGLDALTHAIEAYVNKASHLMVQATAEKSIALIAQNLRLAVLQGDHVQARQNMLVASSLAGVSFNRVRCGVVHAFSLPLGNQFHIPHGIVNAIMLTPCMRFNAPAQPTAFAKIAELFGEHVTGLTLYEAADKAVTAVQRLKRDIGLTETLADFGVTEDRFERIIDEALQSGNMAVNPRLANRDDMRTMLIDGVRGF